MYNLYEISGDRAAVYGPDAYPHVVRNMLDHVLTDLKDAGYGIDSENIIFSAEDTMLFNTINAPGAVDDDWWTLFDDDYDEILTFTPYSAKVHMPDGEIKSYQIIETDESSPENGDMYTLSIIFDAENSELFDSEIYGPGNYADMLQILSDRVIADLSEECTWAEAEAKWFIALDPASCSVLEVSYFDDDSASIVPNEELFITKLSGDGEKKKAENVDVDTPMCGLRAEPSADPEHPGISIDIVTTDADGREYVTNAALIEYDEGRLRAILWENGLQEDPTYIGGFRHIPVNARHLENEADKANKILDEVGYEARLAVSDTDPYIELVDLQGAGSVEAYERFYSAKEIMERLEGYFEDAFLDAEICCDMEGEFSSFEEAEKSARKNGYTEEADRIAYYISLKGGAV